MQADLFGPCGFGVPELLGPLAAMARFGVRSNRTSRIASIRFPRRQSLSWLWTPCPIGRETAGLKQMFHVKQFGKSNVFDPSARLG
jgi:hypothetical protein